MEKIPEIPDGIVKPQSSWFATASFVSGIIGIIFRIFQFNIDDRTINMKMLEIDHFTLLKALTISLVIVNILGFIIGIIASKRKISNRWMAIVGAFGNAFAMHLFLVLLSGSGLHH